MEAIATKLGRGSFRNDSLSLSSERGNGERDRIAMATGERCWSDGALLLAKLGRRTTGVSANLLSFRRIVTRGNSFWREKSVVVGSSNGIFNVRN